MSFPPKKNRNLGNYSHGWQRKRQPLKPKFPDFQIFRTFDHFKKMNDEPFNEEIGQMDLYNSDGVTGRFTPLKSLFHGIKGEFQFLGVIVSVGMPKRTSGGTHKNAISYSVIDPSVPEPCQSFALNWFFNDPQTPTTVSIGDVVLCQGMRCNVYRDHPQITGNADKSMMLLFHARQPLNSMDFTSLPHVIAVRANWMDRLLLADPNGYPSTHASTHASASTSVSTTGPPSAGPPPVGPYGPLLSRDHWILNTQGKRASYTWAKMNPVCSWVVQLLGRFAGDILTTHFLSDLSLTLQNICSKGTAGNDKFDSIALVVGYHPAENPTVSGKLGVWDGTTDGTVTVLPAIRTALDTALPTNTLPQDGILLGRELILQAADGTANALLAAIAPGTFVRLRNVYPKACAQGITLEIRSDSHICPFDPSYRDAKELVSRYQMRVEAVQAAATAAAAAAAEASARAARAPPHKNTNADGVPFTPLFKVVGLPAPARFACFGQILSWKPQDVRRFAIVSKFPKESADASEAPATPTTPDRHEQMQMTQHSPASPVLTQQGDEDEEFISTQVTLIDGTQQEQTLTPTASPEKEIRKVLMFSLKLTDGTTEGVDVLFYEDDAEHFLGLTPNNFDDECVVERLTAQLQSARDTKREIEVYIKSYTLPSEEPVREEKDPTKKVPYKKRLRGYDCQLVPVHDNKKSKK